MDLLDYSLSQQELEEITNRLQDFKNSLFLELVVLMDDGGRLVSYAPYVDTLKPMVQRVAIVGAAVVGAVDQLEHVISSKRNMYFSGVDKNMYVHVIDQKFLLASVFNHKVPLGSVKLMKERLSREIGEILKRARSRNQKKVVRFEDLAI
ncbi:MAG: hypothetical protein ACK42C_00665 [Aquificaceae bacterium]|jgi:predicted regulator of Ras-like GTPase activity (Roadblock/LC7/MglB family)|uniref:hypothetical protein n=1 Tax=Hydrogenobacter sp. Uz 6-8 TaxID=3384828 RepID=UPI0030B7B657